jgi:hypothetical protein
MRVPLRVTFPEEVFICSGSIFYFFVSVSVNGVSFSYSFFLILELISLWGTLCTAERWFRKLPF